MQLKPQLPAELERILNKALEKDRELRYQSASDLRGDLKRLKRDSESGRSTAVATPPDPVQSREAGGDLQCSCWLFCRDVLLVYPFEKKGR